MKVKTSLLICLFILGNNKAIGQTLKAERKVIILDAGHGGIDSGTISEDGLQEKDVVLDIARSMVAWNNDLLDSKYDIYLTRNKDTLIALADRTLLAEYLEPGVFISLHCNHNDDSKITGIELYTYGRDKLSLSYVKSISKVLNQHLGFKTKRPKQADFQVLRETKGLCPSVLIELGYLSNSDESHYLNDGQNRKALALAILTAL